MALTIYGWFLGCGLLTHRGKSTVCHPFPLLGLYGRSGEIGDEAREGGFLKVIPTVFGDFEHE
jgi:hypothetical protein